MNRGASLRYLRTLLKWDGPIHPTANDWIEDHRHLLRTDGQPRIGDVCCWTSLVGPGFVALVVGIDLVLVWHQDKPLVQPWKTFGPARYLDFAGYVRLP